MKVAIPFYAAKTYDYTIFMAPSHEILKFKKHNNVHGNSQEQYSDFQMNRMRRTEWCLLVIV
jgi:hypothetical protein